MVSAKQKAARSRFSWIMQHGGFKKHRTRKLKARVVRTYHKVRDMAKGKRRRGSRKGFLGGGIMSIIGPAVAGYLGSSVSPSIPVVNTLPYSNVIAGAGAGYLIGKKKGALIGAATALLAPSIMGAVSSGTQEAW